MAIFGRVMWVVPGVGERVFREGNNWDVFLNYFFAVFFIFCFIIGILLNPFIIAYHAQQKRTFTKFLFLLVSSMDLFKSLYFPLVLVPKLFSPLAEDDYYYNWDLTNVSWTAYSNNFFLCLIFFEVDVLIVLNVARYFSFTRPLSSTLKRNIVLIAVLLFHFLNRLTTFLGLFFFQDILYSRIYDCVVPKGAVGTLSIFRCVIFVLSTTVGGIFIYLTVCHLKNSDTASSEVSNRNIRRGIASLVAMSVFNVFILALSVCYYTAMHILKSSDWIVQDSTFFDFIQFMVPYGIPLSQSVFNSLSILVICTSFRDFVKKCVRERRIANIS